MGQEIDLLVNYPRTKRDVKQRGAEKTEQDRAIARQFEEAFFDGDRRHGYGGFSYHSRFWQPVVPTFQEFYQLDRQSSLLDIGCAKGFMLNDFQELIPGMDVTGIDVSQYAIEHSVDTVASKVQVADARELPFEDNSFDLVISINTIHNLEREDLICALKEIERVSRKHAFITVDAYRSDVEKDAMFAWNLTAKTILSVPEWIELFKEAGYTGDYYWFVP
jgi:ubiquinone/menaquinone biosynthesis C-methylase UbiE